MSVAVNYLLELRKRLLWCIGVVVVVFVGLTFFARQLYQFIAIPLVHHLNSGQSLIATAITSPFLAPFKLAFVIAIVISIPVLLYHLWAFIAPALYQHERRFVWLLLVMSSILFYAGMAFAYFLVLPLVLKFFIHMAPQSVTVMPDISEYLNFVIKIFFAFGIAFEVPVLTVLLIRTGITSKGALAKKRPFIIVGAFVVGMVLTPPDVISQVLLAIPIWLLFELGLVLSGFGLKVDAREKLTHN